MRLILSFKFDCLNQFIKSLNFKIKHAAYARIRPLINYLSVYLCITEQKYIKMMLTVNRYFHRFDLFLDKVIKTLETSYAKYK